MPEPKGPSLYDGPFASFYDRYFGSHGSILALKLLDLWSRPGETPPVPSVLDLGCGGGHLALPLLEAGYSVTGLDLSGPMLEKAEIRCARYLPEGRASFLLQDIVSFKPLGPFGAAVSSYNSINHLADAEELKACFRSVRASLHGEGVFFFDLHTQKGLRAWARSERGRWADAQVEVTGDFEGEGTSAWMRIQGRQGDLDFEGTIHNFARPLEEVRSILRDAGFPRVVLSDLEELGEPLMEPESLDRVMVIARP